MEIVINTSVPQIEAEGPQDDITRRLRALRPARPRQQGETQTKARTGAAAVALFEASMRQDQESPTQRNAVELAKQEAGGPPPEGAPQAPNAGTGSEQTSGETAGV